MSDREQLGRCGRLWANAALLEARVRPQDNVIDVGARAGAVTGYQGLAFGPEAVGWAIGDDCQARRSKADDFGRQDLMIWRAIEGWALLNSAIVEKLITS
jgi:hypothetical protein